MTRIANGQTARGREECRHNGCGEDGLPRKLAELPVHQTHEFGLIQTIDEAAHEQPQIRCCSSYRGPVPCYVSQQESCDSSRCATRGIIYVAAVMRLAI